MTLISEKTRLPSWFICLFRAEFWPYVLIHSPAIVYLLYKSLKLKTPFIPSLLNPAIEEPGNFFKSGKKDILSCFPEKYLINGLQYSPEMDLNVFIDLVNVKIGYPCFIKPECLFQGIGVRKIDTEAALMHYLNTFKNEALVQESLPPEKEFAVFTVRFPGEKVRITSLTGKEFLVVNGDGKSNLKQLLKHNLRYKMAKAQIDPFWADKMNLILPENEELLIQPIGNHNKGTRFFDLSQQINIKMEDLFDKILPQSGIHYGRFDVKAPSLLSLETGEGLKIIEFNGAIADPVHYLDSKYNWFQMQKIILRHCKMQYKLAKQLRPSSTSKKGFTDGIKLVFTGIKRRRIARKEYSK